MKEDQHSEPKKAWDNEYTRYIFAFCNTEGGILYIGMDQERIVIGKQLNSK